MASKFKKPVGSFGSENFDDIYGGEGKKGFSPEAEPPKPEGYKPAPEVKSRRVQVLLPPSLHDRLKTIAANENTSVNDLVNLGLEKAYPM